MSVCTFGHWGVGGGVKRTNLKWIKLCFLFHREQLLSTGPEIKTLGVNKSL